MENQDFIKLLEDLKNAGLIYNDADFSRKTGLQPSFVSEMKTGKKPFTGKCRRIVEESFPDFFNRKTVQMTGDEPTLGQMYQALVDHDIRFHDLASRILDGMGVAPAKKEKTA